MANIVTTGLQLYLNSKQGVSGTSWSDLSGNNLTATINGNVSVGANGMNFPAGTTSDNVKITIPSMLHGSPASSFTFEFYIIATNFNGHIMFDGNAGNYWVGSGGISARPLLVSGSSGGANASGGGPSATGTPYFVSIVYDSSAATFTFYVNGAQAGTVQSVAGNTYNFCNDATNYLGTNQSGSMWNGVLDCVRLYNRALSAAEVSQNYSVGTSVGLPSGGTTVTGSASGGSASGGAATGAETISANVQGGSTSGGSASGVQTLSASSQGGSISGGSVSSTATQSASVFGGSTSGGSASGTFLQTASASGGSTSGGTATGNASATVDGSASGGSVSGGSATGVQGTTVQASASGGSSSGGQASNPVYAQTASVGGGSTSGGTSTGAILMSTSTRGGSVTGGQAFANLLQQAFASGGSVSGGSAYGGIPGMVNGSASGGSTSGGSASGMQLVITTILQGSIDPIQVILGSIDPIQVLGGDIDVPSVGQNITIYQSNDDPFQINLTNESGGPLDVTGANIEWVLQRAVDSPSPALITKRTTDNSITIIDAVGGKILVSLNPTDTAGLPAGPYYHEARLQGSPVKTLTIGKATIVGTSKNM